MNRQNSFSSENDNFASEKSIGIKMSTSPKTIATVHEFHLHYSDFYDCGFKSLVMVAFVNGFFNPKSRKIFVKEGYFVIFKEKKIDLKSLQYTQFDSDCTHYVYISDGNGNGITYYITVKDGKYKLDLRYRM